MTDKRAYFRVDVGYLANPKVANLAEENPRAVLLHLQCIAYATQHATDGVVPMRLAMRQACAEQCHLDLLVQCGLLEVVDERNVMVHDYLEHQRSASEVKSASDKGKAAAEARWAKDQADAPSNASSMLNPMPREKERKKEEDTALRADFDTWYGVYPKHVGVAAARKSYAKARKTADAETLLAAAYVMARAYATDKKFCPNPATWLNQERWADETAPEPSGRHLQVVETPTRDAQIRYEQQQAVAPDPGALPW